MTKILGTEPTAAAGRIRPGETFEAYAARRYTAQMDYYSAAGASGLLSWEQQSLTTRASWIASSKKLAKQEG